MKSIKYILVALVLVLVPLAPALALEINPIEYSYDYEYQQPPSSTDTIDSYEEVVGLMTVAFFYIFAMGINLLFALAWYIFYSISLMKVGQKLGYENSWFAWIPILSSIMLFQLGNKSPWWLLLVFIPIFGWFALFVLTIMIYMNISEKLGYEKLYGLIPLLPSGELIFFAILGWSKK